MFDTCCLGKVCWIADLLLHFVVEGAVSMKLNTLSKRRHREWNRGVKHKVDQCNSPASPYYISYRAIFDSVLSALGLVLSRYRI